MSLLRFSLLLSSPLLLPPRSPLLISCPGIRIQQECLFFLLWVSRSPGSAATAAASYGESHRER